MLCVYVQVLAEIRSTPLPGFNSSGTPLQLQLLVDHLLHQRLWRTAAALQRQLPQVGQRATSQWSLEEQPAEGVRCMVHVALHGGPQSSPSRGGEVHGACGSAQPMLGFLGLGCL